MGRGLIFLLGDPSTKIKFNPLPLPLGPSADLESFHPLNGTLDSLSPRKALQKNGNPYFNQQMPPFINNTLFLPRRSSFVTEDPRAISFTSTPPRLVSRVRPQWSEADTFKPNRSPHTACWILFHPFITRHFDFSL